MLNGWQRLFSPLKAFRLSLWLVEIDEVSIG